MRTISYTIGALKDLKRHGNVAARIRKALNEFAEGTGAHVNNVTQLVGEAAFRMRVGDFRVIFEATETTIIVTKIGPRGDVYD
jgi:mRNA interferase RelE/StbE